MPTNLAFCFDFARHAFVVMLSLCHIPSVAANIPLFLSLYTFCALFASVRAQHFIIIISSSSSSIYKTFKIGKRNVQGVPQSQTTALPRHKEE